MTGALSQTHITLTPTPEVDRYLDIPPSPGGFLLKHDLDPAANDNTPVFLHQAA